MSVSDHGVLDVKEAWAAWKDDLHDLGLARVEVLSQFQKHLKRVENRSNQQQESGKKKLSKLQAQAANKCEGLIDLLHANESSFMQQMGAKAQALATLQVQLTDFITDPVAASSVSDLVSAAALIQYLVTVFTAITFFRLPATWKPNCRKADKNKAALRSALEGLGENEEVVRIELNSGHKIVAQMRQNMRLPGPTKTKTKQHAASGQEEDTVAAHTTAAASGQEGATAASGQVGEASSSSNNTPTVVVSGVGQDVAVVGSTDKSESEAEDEGGESDDEVSDETVASHESGMDDAAASGQVDEVSDEAAPSLTSCSGGKSGKPKAKAKGKPKSGGKGKAKAKAKAKGNVEAFGKGWRQQAGRRAMKKMRQVDIMTSLTNKK